MIVLTPPRFVSNLAELSEAFPNRKRFTRADCDLMERVGILSQRYELIDGEIILKMGQNLPHGIAVMRAILWLVGVFGGERVQTRVSVEITGSDQETSLPEPDVMVLAQNAAAYTLRPRSSDLLLAVEVSDTTLRGDLLVKAEVYARAGVPEYWVLDVQARRVIVHRDPADGTYRSVTAYFENDSIAPLAAPNNALRIGDLLPPREQAQV